MMGLWASPKDKFLSNKLVTLNPCILYYGNSNTRGNFLVEARMRKLLYITVNTKPEELSSSKTVGREFVKRFLEKNHNYSLDEIDLYDFIFPFLSIPGLHRGRTLYRVRNMMLSLLRIRKVSTQSICYPISFWKQTAMS